MRWRLSRIETRQFEKKRADGIHPPFLCTHTSLPLDIHFLFLLHVTLRALAAIGVSGPNVGVTTNLPMTSKAVVSHKNAMRNGWRRFGMGSSPLAWFGQTNKCRLHKWLKIFPVAPHVTLQTLGVLRMRDRTNRFMTFFDPELLGMTLQATTTVVLSVPEMINRRRRREKRAVLLVRPQHGAPFHYHELPVSG